MLFRIWENFEGKKFLLATTSNGEKEILRFDKKLVEDENVEEYYG